MSALTYTQLQSVLLAMLAQAPSPYNVIPPDFAELYPRAISYAESRIYAEIPFLAVRTQNSASTVTPGSRTFNLAAMDVVFSVVERVALITPFFATAAGGVRYQYIKTTLDYIDMFWPTESQTLAPNLANNIGRYWSYIAIANNQTFNVSQIAIAPTPDLAYNIEVTGLMNPTPLSGTSTTTYLSTTYPDLLTAACMVFLEGALQRNYGAAADDPQAALSWEGQYRTLKAACEFEEKRRRGMVADQPSNPPPTPVGR